MSTLDDYVKQGLAKVALDNKYVTLYWVSDPTVAVFTIKTPWRVMSPGVIEALDEVLDLIEDDDDIVGFISYNDHGPFSNGFDLEVIKKIMEDSEEDWDGAEKEVRSIIEAGQRVFDRLYTFPKPTVAAVGGWARGGGYEFALSHGYIMSGDNLGVENALKPWYVQVQLPEVKQVGLIPGWNGIPRVIKRALAGEAARKPNADPERIYKAAMTKVIEKVVLSGWNVDPKDAAKRLLIDEIVQRNWPKNGNNRKVLEAALVRAVEFAEDYVPNKLEPVLLKPAPLPEYQEGMEDPQVPTDFAYQSLYSMIKDDSGSPIEEERPWDEVSRYSCDTLIALTKKPEIRKALISYVDFALGFLDDIEKENPGGILGWERKD